jgi:hypothetical protein
MIGGDEGSTSRRRRARRLVEFSDATRTLSAPQARRPGAALPGSGATLGASARPLRDGYLSRGRPAAERWAGPNSTDNPPFAGEPPVERIQELVELGFDHFQMVFAGF